MIYWPESDDQGELEAVLDIVKKWRTDNGKLGFRED
nr:bacteriocin immunity protein [Pseudomonas faucium]